MFSPFFFIADKCILDTVVRTVIINDHSTDLALEAVETIKTQTKNPHVEFIYVDLTSLEDIHKFANKIEQHTINMFVNSKLIDTLCLGYSCRLV